VAYGLQRESPVWLTGRWYVCWLHRGFKIVS